MNILRLIVAAATTAAIVLPIAAQTQNANQLYQQERADCLYEARSALRDRRAGGLEPGASSATGSPSSDTPGSTDALPPRADRG